MCAWIHGIRESEHIAEQGAAYQESTAAHCLRKLRAMVEKDVADAVVSCQAPASDDDQGTFVF